MTTSQIIIVVGFVIIYLILFITAWISKDGAKRDNYMGFSLIAFFFVMTLWISTLIYMNQYIKKAMGKCPEYEKLENVYKLKELK